MGKRAILSAAGLALAAGVISGGANVAGGDGEGAPTGPGRAAAVDAALAATGGGTANTVERDSEKGATWEVEITRTDGTTVDVRLDEGYVILAVDGGGEG